MLFSYLCLSHIHKHAAYMLPPLCPCARGSPVPTPTRPHLPAAWRLCPSRACTPAGTEAPRWAQNHTASPASTLPLSSPDRSAQGSPRETLTAKACGKLHEVGIISIHVSCSVHIPLRVSAKDPGLSGSQAQPGCLQRGRSGTVIAS